MKTKDEDFMCRCNAEAEAEAESVLQEARAHAVARLGDDVRDKYGGSDLWFADMLLYDLALDGDLSIAADQWGGIGYGLYDLEATAQSVKAGKLEHVYKANCHVQCDSFIDGLAWIYLWKQRQEKEVADASNDAGQGSGAASAS